MAYMKYKELTKYFNFNDEIDPKDLPKYAHDYVDTGEQIYAVYKTKRDKAIFTNDRMILFDVFYFFGLSKKIHMIPYKSISTSAIIFGRTSASILLSMDSGYQIKLNFVGLNPAKKTRLRLLYSHVMNKIRK